MMQTYPFRQVDVFASGPHSGNPLAVVHAADGLSDRQMARFARWTNLSETAFLLSPTEDGADYRVRIFTPGAELPFAGHPTLGACAAWLAAGGRPARPGLVVQQCGIGQVPLRDRDGRLAFRAPPLQRCEPIDDATLRRIAAALGTEPRAFIDSRWLVNGPTWATVMVRSRDELLALVPDFSRFGDLAVGVVAPQPGGDLAFEVRAFAPALGVPEDPVTGSLQAAIAQWLIGEGLAPPRYSAGQGTAIGRAGRVQVERSGAEIWVGGEVAVIVEGSVRL